LLLQGSFVCSPRQVRGETNDPVQAPGGAGIGSSTTPTNRKI